MIDTSLASFERDVIEASMEVPVLLDFWAPWCEPCKSLGPLLEKLEREYGGRFRLVNVNSDTNPELVSSFNLKSVPHSVAFVDGNAVAQFMGAQPEAFVRAFLDRLIPNPSAIEHRAARPPERKRPLRAHGPRGPAHRAPGIPAGARAAA
jgi:putative thioredoxin